MVLLLKIIAWLALIFALESVSIPLCVWNKFLIYSFPMHVCVLTPNPFYSLHVYPGGGGEVLFGWSPEVSFPLLLLEMLGGIIKNEINI